MIKNPFDLREDVTIPDEVREWLDNQYADSQQELSDQSNEEYEESEEDRLIAIRQIDTTKKAIEYLRKISGQIALLERAVILADTEDFLTMARMTPEQLDESKELSNLLYAARGQPKPEIHSIEEVIMHAEAIVTTPFTQENEPIYSATLIYGFPHYARRIAKHAWDIQNNP